MAKKKRPIPLVKGTTAASLVKQKAEMDKKSSRKRRRKIRKNLVENNEKETFSSTAESLAVISEYHTLNKRLEQIEHDESLTSDERQISIQKIKEQQEALGGLDRYQKASIYGAKSSKFVCADWVVPLLNPSKSYRSTTKGNDPTNDKTKRRLRILDVGAIDNQYFEYRDMLDVVPIDLHGGQHDSVLQIDFFDYAHAYCTGTDLYELKDPINSNKQSRSKSIQPEAFDAIVMSLVLNFQGDPRKRGDMLALACDPRLLSQHGMLFVALPSASLDNSRYCDLERFIQVCTNPIFGLEVVEQKHSAKLILLAFRRKVPNSSHPKNHGNCYDISNKTFDYGDHEMKRMQPPKPGPKRNNFAVILKSSHNRTTGTIPTV